MADLTPIPLDADASSSADILTLESAEGISPEDKAEILQQIEKVAQENRITLNDTAFHVTAQKSGWKFPIILNLTGLLVLGLGILALVMAFRSEESQIQQVQTVSTTGEGQIINQLRKEMESQLLAKDQEIQNIQNRLGSITKERQELQQNFDSKVRERENFLRQELERQLEEERTRLRAQGLSEEVIQSRLKVFEEEKNRQFQKQLADFISQAQAEKNSLVENLTRTQQDFESRLTNLNTERQRLLEESRKRESELRAQLESQSKTAEQRASAAEALLNKAKDELENLNKVKEKSAAAEAQLAGIYLNIAQSLQKREFERAGVQTQELKKFLAEPSILGLPFMIPRLESDLSMAATLESLATSEINRMKAESAQFAQAAQDSTVAIRALTAAADQRLQAGDIAGAEELYLQALGRIPQVLTTHEYFLKKKLAEERTLRDRRDQWLARGEEAFIQGNLKGALSAYSQALDLIPLAGAQRDAFLGRVQEVGYVLLSQEKGPLPYETPVAPLQEAEELLASRPGEALGLFLGFLEKYPASKQSQRAIEGIRQAGSLITAAPASSSGTAQQLLALQKEKADLEKTVISLRLQNTRDQETISKKDVELGTLKAQVTQLNTRLGEMNAAAAAQNPDEALKAEIARLTPAAALWEKLGTDYKTYTQKEGQILAGPQSTSSLLEARLYLDSFLVSEAAVAAMPGLKDRFGRYEKAYQEAGQRETLVNLSDVVDNLSKLETPQEKKAYLTNIQRRYRDNKTLLEFLQKLSVLF